MFDYLDDSHSGRVDYFSWVQGMRLRDMPAIAQRIRQTMATDAAAASSLGGGAAAPGHSNGDASSRDPQSLGAGPGLAGGGGGSAAAPAAAAVDWRSRLLQRCLTEEEVQLVDAMMSR